MLDQHDTSASWRTYVKISCLTAGLLLLAGAGLIAWQPSSHGVAPSAAFSHARSSHISLTHTSCEPPSQSQCALVHHLPSIVVVEDSLACRDFTEPLITALQQRGYNVTRQQVLGDPRTLDPSTIYILLSLMKLKNIPMQKGNFIAVQLEQWTSGHITKEYLDVLRRMPVVWEFSASAVPLLVAQGVNAVHVPLGRLDDAIANSRPLLSHSPPQPEEFDVLFYGKMNDRRQRFLDAFRAAGITYQHTEAAFGVDRDNLIDRAKLVVNIHLHDGASTEQLRIVQSISRGKLVISEASVDPLPMAEYTDSAEPAAMVKLVKKWLAKSSADRRRRALVHYRNVPLFDSVIPWSQLVLPFAPNLCGRPVRALMVSHDFGGGTATYEDRLRGLYSTSTFTIDTLHVNEERWQQLMTRPAAFSFDPYDVILLQSVMQEVDDKYIIHLGWLLAIIDAKKRIILTVHDFQYIQPDPVQLRLSRMMFAACESIIFPSRFIRDTYHQLWPEAGGIMHVVPHPDWDERQFTPPFYPKLRMPSEQPQDSASTKQLHGSAPLDPSLPVVRIGLIGQIQRFKGRELLVSMLSHSLPKVLFVVLGQVFPPFSHPQLVETGWYDNAKVFDLIVEQQFDAFWFSSIVPETWSYTLTEGLATGLPLFYCALGAYHERIDQRAHPHDYSPADTPDQVYEKLVAFVAAVRAAGVLPSAKPLVRPNVQMVGRPFYANALRAVTLRQHPSMPPDVPILSTTKLAILLHIGAGRCHRTGALEEPLADIAARLQSIRADAATVPFDLYVSMARESADQDPMTPADAQCLALIRSIDPAAFVLPVSDSGGQGTGGFLLLLPYVLAHSQYQYVLKMHTADTEPELPLSPSRAELLSPLIGSADALRASLRVMQKQPRVGMVASAPWILYAQQDVSRGLDHARTRPTDAGAAPFAFPPPHDRFLLQLAHRFRLGQDPATASAPAQYVVGGVFLVRRSLLQRYFGSESASPQCATDLRDELSADCTFDQQWYARYYRLRSDDAEAVRDHYATFGRPHGLYISAADHRRLRRTGGYRSAGESESESEFASESGSHRRLTESESDHAGTQQPALTRPEEEDQDQDGLMALAYERILGAMVADAGLEIRGIAAAG